jgi:hypothetical protein
MATHPVEPEPLPPEGDTPAPNPSHLPVEPEFGEPAPPPDPGEPLTRPSI